LAYGLLALAACTTTSAWAAAGTGADAPRAVLSKLRGPDGNTVDWSVPERGALVVVFYSSECPISNAYSPTLNRLVAEFPAGKLKLVGVCVDPDLSSADIAAHARDFELKFPVVQDRRGLAAAALGATVTPEAFVIDPTGRVRYHGRIDAQFAARQKRNANPMGEELRDAVTALLDGREVPTAHVEAVGCPIPQPPASTKAPTYSDQVVRILRSRCLECHRKGQVGPFPLETYEQARKRADDIANVVDDRTMPPWKADPHFGVRFKNDRSLTAEEIAVLTAWAEDGAPLGDPSHQGPAPRFPDEWQLGPPDLVLELPEPFAVHASGDDIYRCFVLPTSLPNDVYIRAIEHRPGNRRVVHHMLSYVDISGEGRKKDAADPGPGYSCFSGPGVEIHGDLGGWAPGNEPSQLPDGIGRSLPSKADVILQVHYHPSGKPETDRSRIGIYFAKKPIRQTLHWNAALKHDLKVPPGESNFKAEASWTVPVDVEAYAVTPHMHLLGKDMTMWLKFPDGKTQDLVKVPDWDFGWQTSYFFEKPITLPRGTELKIVAHFDNSADNPHNPNSPPKLVEWGEATTDEMCIGFIALTKKGQDLTRPGEKDDLSEIFKKQRDERRKQFEKRQRERRKPAEKAD
jgi:peroxiredoxin